MSFPLSDNAWHSTLSFCLVVSMVSVLVILGSEARAQSETRLRLIDEVNEPGGEFVDGDTLSQGTRVAVLRSDRKNTAHAFLNINFDREDLVQEIQEGSAETFRLDRGGETPRRFERTGPSDNYYYVLALTKGGDLLSSYVKDSNRRGDYYPGFATVESGDMVMGPVPEEHRDVLGEALKSVMSNPKEGVGASSQPKEDTSDAGNGKPGPVGPTSAEGGGYLQPLWTVLGSWYGALALGLLAGGMGIWVFLYNVYESKIENKKVRNKIRKDKKSISLRSKLENKEKILKQKNAEIDRLEKALQRSKSSSSSEYSEPNSEPSGSQTGKPDSFDEDVTWSKGVDSGTATVGRVFVEWCRTVDDQDKRQMEHFGEQLGTELSGAEVYRIYREKYAEALVFTDNAREPVEYWLVHLEEQDLLLPKPQQAGFLELEKCYEVGNGSTGSAEPMLSSISPKDVKHLLPATLVEEGGRGKTLKEKGYIDLDDAGGSQPQGRLGEHADDTISSASGAKPAAKTIGEVFVEWCHSETAMIGRYYMFERMLRETQSNAEVSPIYRRSDADGRYSFDADNTSGEFWLVEVEGDRWLLPAPRKRDRFVAIGQAFNGDHASPSSLSEVKPAQMNPDGAQHKLQHPGHMEAAASK